MYRRILVTLDHSLADETILTHIEQLHRYIQSEVILLHVADGWVARHYDELGLKVSEEMREDVAYLERVAKQLQDKGISTKYELALGDPASEIVKFASQHECDLIAMSTHGHRFLADFIHGATVTKVRHQVDIPLLLVRAPRCTDRTA